MTVAAFVTAFARLSAHLSSSTLTAPSLFADKSICFMSIFLHANIIWNNIHNPQKYLRFSVTDGIIYLGNHQKYNLLHSIPPTPRVAVPKKTDGGSCNDRLRQDGYFPRREPSESFCPFAAATGLFASQNKQNYTGDRLFLRCPRFFAF